MKVLLLIPLLMLLISCGAEESAGTEGSGTLASMEAGLLAEGERDSVAPRSLDALRAGEVQRSGRAPDLAEGGGESGAVANWAIAEDLAYSPARARAEAAQGLRSPHARSRATVGEAGAALDPLRELLHGLQLRRSIASALPAGDRLEGFSVDDEGRVLSAYGSTADGLRWVDVGGRPHHYGVSSPDLPWESSDPLIIVRAEEEKQSVRLVLGAQQSAGELRLVPDGAHLDLESMAEDAPGGLTGLRYALDMSAGPQGDLRPASAAGRGWMPELAAYEARDWGHARDIYLVGLQDVRFLHVMESLPDKAPHEDYVVREYIELDPGLQLRMEGGPLETGETRTTTLGFGVERAADGESLGVAFGRAMAWDAVGHDSDMMREHRLDPRGAFHRVTRVDAGRYRVELVVEADWLLADERVFPVVVDPSLRFLDLAALPSGTLPTENFWHEPFNQYHAHSQTQYYLTRDQLQAIPRGSAIVGMSWWNRTSADVSLSQFTRNNAWAQLVDGGLTNGFPNAFVNQGRPFIDDLAGNPALWEGTSGSFLQSAPPPPPVPENSCVTRCGRAPGDPNGPVGCSCAVDCGATGNCCDDINVCGQGQASCFGNCGGTALSGCRCDVDCVDEGGCCDDAVICFEDLTPDPIPPYEPPTGPWSCVDRCGQGISGGCYCDGACSSFGDCCQGVEGVLSSDTTHRNQACNVPIAESCAPGGACGTVRSQEICQLREPSRTSNCWLSGRFANNYAYRYSGVLQGYYRAAVGIWGNHTTWTWHPSGWVAPDGQQWFEWIPGAGIWVGTGGTLWPSGNRNYTVLDEWCVFSNSPCLISDTVEICSCEANCGTPGSLPCCANKELFCGDGGDLPDTCLGYCGGLSPSGNCSCAPTCGQAGQPPCCSDYEFYCAIGDTCVGACGGTALSGNCDCSPGCDPNSTGPSGCCQDACLVCGEGCGAPPGDSYAVREGWFGSFSFTSPNENILQNADKFTGGTADFLFRNTNNSLRIFAGHLDGTASTFPRPEFQFVECPSTSQTFCEIYYYGAAQQLTGLAWPSHPRTRLVFHEPQALAPNTALVDFVPPGRHNLNLYTFERGTECDARIALSPSGNPAQASHCDQMRMFLFDDGLTSPIATETGCGTITLPAGAATDRYFLKVDVQNRNQTTDRVYTIRLENDEELVDPPEPQLVSSAVTSLVWRYAASGGSGTNYTLSHLPSGTVPATTPDTDFTVSGLSPNTCYALNVQASSSCGDPVQASREAATRLAAPQSGDFTTQVVGNRLQLTVDPARVPGLGDGASCAGQGNATAIELRIRPDAGDPTPPMVIASEPGQPNVFLLPEAFSGCVTIDLRYTNRLGIDTERVSFELDGVPPALQGLIGFATSATSIDWNWSAVSCASTYEGANVPGTPLATGLTPSAPGAPVVWSQDGLSPNTCYTGAARAVGLDGTPSAWVTTLPGGAPVQVATLAPQPTAPSFAGAGDGSFDVTGAADLQSLEVNLSAGALPNLGTAETCGGAENRTRVDVQFRPCETQRFAQLSGALPVPLPVPSASPSDWIEAPGGTITHPTQGHHCWETRARFVNLAGVAGAPSSWLQWRGVDLEAPELTGASDIGLGQLTWNFRDLSLSEDFWRVRTRLCPRFSDCVGATNPDSWSSNVSTSGPLASATVSQRATPGSPDPTLEYAYTFEAGTSGIRRFGNIAYQSAAQASLIHSIGVGEVLESGAWSEPLVAFTRAAPPEICGQIGGDSGFCGNWQDSRDLIMTALRCEPEDPQGQPWEACSIDFRIGGLGAFSPDEPDQNISNNRCTRRAGASLVRERVEVDGEGNVINVLEAPVPLVVNECLDPSNEALCNQNRCGSQNPDSAFPGRYGFGVSGDPYWPGRHEGRVSDEGLEYGATYRYTMRYYNSDGVPSEATSFLFTIGCQFGEDGVCAEGIQNTRPVDTGGALVDINVANAAQLETLPQIGAGRATAIIDYRVANGPFATPENLTDVPGIDEGIFLGLCDRITASGVAPTTEGCGRTIVSASASACVYPGYDGFERCDGVDWSCSGDPTTEFGQTTPISEPCYEGPGGTAGVGVCAEGEQFCIETPEGSGVFAFAGECVGQVLPGDVEVCDGQDNTCSGDPFDVDFGDDFCGGFVSTFPTGSNPITEVVHTSVILSATNGRLETSEGSGTFVCVNGTPTCDASGIGCENFFINACGGCDELTNASGEPVVLGEPCGECEDQVWECDGAGGATCSGSDIGGADCEIDGALGLCAQGVTVCGPDGVTCEPTYTPDPDAPADFCDLDDLDCDGDPFNDARIARVEITGFGSAGVGDIEGFASTPQQLADPAFELTFNAAEDCDMRSGDGACSVVEFLVENEGNDVIPAGSLVSLERLDVSRPLTGLLGEYFTGRSFENLAFERVDREIDFSWGSGSPSPPLSANNFSVRWRGTITAPATGEYTFIARTSDGVRLVIDGLPVITNWRTQSISNSTGTIFLEEGQPVPFAMFYYDAAGNAAARLEWEGPGVSGRQVVPESAFAPHEGELISPRIALPRDVPPQFSDSFTYCWESQETTFDTTLRVVIEDPQSEQNQGLACIGTWRPESLEGSEPLAGLNLVRCGPEICDGYDNNLNGLVNEFPEACGDVSLECLSVPTAACGAFNDFNCPQPGMNCNPDLGYCFICAGVAKEE